MDFVNRTPLVARLEIGAETASGRRAGLLAAKATFAWDGAGRARLDGQSPLPLFGEDQETELGLLPRDDMPRNDLAFEVCLLGKAHAPGGLPAKEVRVALTVGSVRRELDVIGPRFWVGAGPHAVPSEPEPFTTMPLVYARAFGGSVDILVDQDSPMLVEHPDNPGGVGFDPAPQAAELDRLLSCPPGYPRFPRERALPNVERPDQRIRSYADSPEPEVWAAVPLASRIHGMRCFQQVGEGTEARAELLPGHLHRAHPAWVLERAPDAGSPMVLEHLTPQATLAIAFPSLAVHFDYVLGEREGTRRLWPSALVLLPEERRFTVLYRLAFEVEAPQGQVRSGRLRVEEGARG